MQYQELGFLSELILFSPTSEEIRLFSSGLGEEIRPSPVYSRAFSQILNLTWNHLHPVFRTTCSQNRSNDWKIGKLLIFDRKIYSFDFFPLFSIYLFYFIFFVLFFSPRVWENSNVEEWNGKRRDDDDDEQDEDEGDQRLNQNKTKFHFHFVVRKTFNNFCKLLVVIKFPTLSVLSLRRKQKQWNLCCVLFTL